MKNFADQLTTGIREKRNPTVMGLDPVLEYIPDSIIRFFRDQCDDPTMASGLAIFEFNRRLIESTAEIIPAVKLQMAFYEQYGIHGIEALYRTAEYAHNKGLIVIADGKRNDIGSTAAAYARAILGTTTMIDGSEKMMLNADAVTINAYLGFDGVQPFLDQCRENGKGLFILVRTSNPSAGDLQDQVLSSGRTVYEKMAELTAQWGSDLIGECGYSAIGAVIGATWPLQASRLRKLMPSAFVLIPGYGAQGGSADDAVRSFGVDGGGGIVNASRSLMCAWKNLGMQHEQFDLATRREAKNMQKALNEALERKNSSNDPLTLA